MHLPLRRCWLLLTGHPSPTSSPAGWSPKVKPPVNETDRDYRRVPLSFLARGGHRLHSSSLASPRQCGRDFPRPLSLSPPH